MTSTSSSLPICVYCGTPRPADETRCPNCGKPWIDVNVDDSLPATAIGAAVVASAAAPDTAPQPPQLDEMGEFGFDEWTLPPEPKPSRAKWLIPLVLLLTVAALWVLVFVDRSGPAATTTVVASDTTTSLATTTTAAETTTTQAEATTTSSTTTTVPYPAADSWPAVGDPIPVPALTLKASFIGPIAFGTAIADAAGALVASLGTGETAGFDSSMCADPEWYWITWGDLRGIFDGYDDDATLIAYRYESDGDVAPDPTLETLSGLRVGDSVETLQSIYAPFTVSFEVIDGKDHFRLSDDGEALLWGPLSSAEPQGIVEGIYSPDPCSAGN